MVNRAAAAAAEKSRPVFVGRRIAIGRRDRKRPIDFIALPMVYVALNYRSRTGTPRQFSFVGSIPVRDESHIGSLLRVRRIYFDGKEMRDVSAGVFKEMPRVGVDATLPGL